MKHIMLSNYKANKPCTLLWWDHCLIHLQAISHRSLHAYKLYP